MATTEERLTALEKAMENISSFLNEMRRTGNSANEVEEELTATTAFIKSKE